MEEQASEKRSDTLINNYCPVLHRAFKKEFIQGRWLLSAYQTSNSR